MKSTCFEQFDCLHRKPREIHHSSSFIEQADEGHQVQALGWSVSVRKWCRQYFNSFWFEQAAYLLNACCVRAISVPNEARFCIETDHGSGSCLRTRLDRAKNWGAN